MSGPKNVLITGANRGLGLEMVKQILQKFKPNNIFATYRDSNSIKELQEVADKNPAVKLVQMDVRDEAKYAQVVNFVDSTTGGSGLNLLINNAGTYHERQSLPELDKTTLMEFLEINTVSTILLTKALLPLLEKASSNSQEPMGIKRAVIMNISSSFASINSNDAGGYLASRCSRAALNAASKNFSVELRPKGIAVVAVSPGWVKTDQGGPDAPLYPNESIRGVLSVLEKVDEKATGKFINYDGVEIPW